MVSHCNQEILVSLSNGHKICERRVLFVNQWRLELQLCSADYFWFHLLCCVMSLLLLLYLSLWKRRLDCELSIINCLRNDSQPF